MKALYAVVFVLFSFAAPAQTLETWIAAYHLDELDCFGETTQQSTMPPQIIGIELLCAAILNDADGIATTGSNGFEDVPVGAVQPSYDNSTEKYLTGSDDLTVDETIEQGATSAQTIAVNRLSRSSARPSSTRRTTSLLPGLTVHRMSRLGRFSLATNCSTVKFSIERATR